MSLPPFRRGSVYSASAPREPRAFRVAFQGLEFNGEMFATDHWNAALTLNSELVLFIRQMLGNQ